MCTASSASCTCFACLSASLYTATVCTPSFCAVLITRHAISPLLAIKIFLMPTLLTLSSLWIGGTLELRALQIWPHLQYGFAISTTYLYAVLPRPIMLPLLGGFDCIALWTVWFFRFVFSAPKGSSDGWASDFCKTNVWAPPPAAEHKWVLAAIQDV